MFGVPQGYPVRQRRQAAPVIYEEKAAGGLLFGFGSLGVALGLALILADSSVAMLLIGLPVVGAGAVGLSRGFAGLCTRIELAPDGIVVTAPTWRLAAVPPVQRLAAPWEEIVAVRHREEAYLLLTNLALPVEVYAIETRRGRIVLGGYYLEELEPVLISVVNRAGADWLEEEALGLDPVATLWRGAPAWDGPQPAASAGLC